MNNDTEEFLFGFIAWIVIGLLSTLLVFGEAHYLESKPQQITVKALLIGTAGGAITATCSVGMGLMCAIKYIVTEPSTCLMNCKE